METNDPLNKIMRKCRAKPELFPKYVLGIELTDDQLEIFRLVFSKRKVAVPSGHTVGKSYLAAVIALTFLYVYPNSKVITTAQNFTQCKRVMWGNIRKMFYGAKLPLGGKINQAELNLGPDWFAIGVANDSPDGFQGHHAEDILVIFDECQTIDREIWEATESIISTENAHWLAIANPTILSSPFYDACNDPDWVVKRLSCLNHPNVKEGKIVIPGAVHPDWPAQMKAQWGEESPEYKSRVLGEFPDTDDGTLITVSVLRNALTHFDPYESDIHMGVDVARFGDDRSVATIVEGSKVLAVETWRKADTMETAGRIIALMEEYGIPPANIHIEVNGIGAGVVDRLIEQNYPIDSVDVAAKPVGDWHSIVKDTKFANRRAELWWVASILLRTGQLQVPEEFSDTWRDLKDLTYKYNSQGCIVMESKADLKKRIGRSPDFADSLIIALSRANSGCGLYLI